jgi:Mn-dependent DtxR family transcriptional regulator
MENPQPGTLDYHILIQFLFNETGIRPGELAIKLKTHHSTVNSAIKRMEGKGYLVWKPYGDIELTELGKDALRHIEVHFHLIEVFLVESLGLNLEEAHNESLDLAPHVSCSLIKSICQKFGQPKTCPKNIEIPDYPACHSHN